MKHIIWKHLKRILQNYNKKSCWWLSCVSYDEFAMLILMRQTDCVSLGVSEFKSTSHTQLTVWSEENTSAADLIQELWMNIFCAHLVLSFFARCNFLWFFFFLLKCLLSIHASAVFRLSCWRTCRGHPPLTLDYSPTLRSVRLREGLGMLSLEIEFLPLVCFLWWVCHANTDVSDWLCLSGRKWVQTQLLTLAVWTEETPGTSCSIIFLLNLTHIG